jgi:uncharacterized membrane protein
MLVRRGAYPEAFMWWLSVVAAVIYLPLGAYLFARHGVSADGWPFVVATIAIHALYFVLLGRAYEHGDLSLVYPIARGTGPLLVPLFAVPFLGERLSLVGALGIGLILVGVVSLQVGGVGPAALRRLGAAMGLPAARYALAVGVTIAVYSVVDKVGVGLVEPVLYTYLIFPGSVVLAGPYFWARSRAAVVGSWRENRRSLLLAGALAPASYGLALSAFRLGQVSYLAPMREVSIVVAALLGAVVLREELTRARLASVVVTAAGVVLIGLGA